MKNKQSIFLFAGEQSGDLHGGKLLKALTKKLPFCHFYGVGGPHMREERFSPVMNMEKFQAMGFSEVIGSLWTIWRRFRTLKKDILKTNPEAVILIDYPGFNLRMASALRKGGYKGKLIQYISPSVWAWGKKRILKMEKALDLLMTIYPFEPTCFEATSLQTEYVGNPVQESVQNHSYREEWANLFGISPAQSLLAIFPGSRNSEIRHNLPLQIQAAQEVVKQAGPLQIGISCANTDIMKVVTKALEKTKLELNKQVFLIPKVYSYELMRDCKAAIATSGTVTLELALHKTPSVVGYYVSPFNRFVAKYLLRVNLPHYCIVNILNQKTTYPELITQGYNPKNLAKKTLELLRDTPERDACIAGCQEILNGLHIDSPSEKAAEKVLGCLDGE